MTPTFQTGRGARVLWDATNLSPIMTDTTIDVTCPPAEATTYESSTGTPGAPGATVNDRVYIAGKRDAMVNFEGLFDGSTSEYDNVVNTDLGGSTKSVITIGVAQDTIGNRARLVLGDAAKYGTSVPASDVVSVSASAQASEERAGYWLAPLAARTSTGALTAVSDPTASTTSGGSTSGGVAHLHITALSTASTGRVLVQHSTDGSSWADLLTFNFSNTSTSTGGTVTRSTVAGTVKERLRANLHQLSASDSVTFAVAFARHNQ